MILHKTTSELPTTVSLDNSSVFIGTTPICRNTSDKLPEPLSVCRNLAGNSDYFRQISGKNRGQTLVGSVEVPKCKNTFLSGLGGKHAAAVGTSTRPQRSALLDWFEAERRKYAGVVEVQPW